MKYDYTTSRLQVRHLAQVEVCANLLDDIVATLTPEVVRDLPNAFKGIDDRKAAQQWLEKINQDGELLLVYSRATQRLVGMVFLYIQPTYAHIGYLLAQTCWRQGLATELLLGLIDQCRCESPWYRLVAGVSADNLASINLLEKLGFVLDNTQADGSLHYQLSLS
ncbi:GNAT family N-acetyltransferase [Shewanella waksmanii]|uniref:GNAT family N-acetyltransferase n=1 Tax=Shewanella waksmanii TaxID=213783 RepID=UPI00048AFBE3|nr:GNAT family N-acetyltransferase [Shewanella waksmanii]